MYNGKTVGLAISSYVYNAKALGSLRRCLGSLIPRRKHIDETIIVDDCSNYAPVHHYYKTLPQNVKVFRSHTNRGIAATKNICLRLLGHCDYIILADSDLEFKTGWEDFYIGGLHRSGIGSVSLSDIFNDSPAVKTENVNGVNVGYHDKFQGCFMALTKDMYRRVGGLPLLPKKYGQEHYNWQVRIGREMSIGRKVADLVGGKRLVTTNHQAHTFITAPEKDAQSKENAQVSEQILKGQSNYMPPNVERDPARNGDNLCLCIGHRNSTPDRMSNTLAVVDYYRSLVPHADIIVVEQDAHAALQPHLRKDVRYVLAYNKGSYNRSWAFNIAAKMTDRDVLGCMDNDVILKPHTLYHAVNEKIASGEFEIYKPYWKFLDLDARRSNDWKTTFAFSWNDRDLASRCDHLEWLMGGCSFALRSKFVEIGGFNEKFRGWGGEDDEFCHRARQLARTGRVTSGNYDLNLYHLWHNRTKDCTNAQDGYTSNVDELRRVEALSGDGLRNYVRDNLQGQGNVDKYRNEA